MWLNQVNLSSLSFAPFFYTLIVFFAALLFLYILLLATYHSFFVEQTKRGETLEAS